MKKILFVLLVCTLFFGLVACGESAGNESTEPANKETATPETADTEASTAESVEPETTAPETAEATAIGKRSNPVPFGTTATFSNNYYSEDGEEIEATISVTFSNLMRGEEAYNFLLEQNQYNEAAPEGYEWIVFDVSLKLDKGSADDAYYVMPSLNVFSSSGSQIDQTAYATFETGQDFGWVDIFEGGEAVGKVGKLVPVDDDVLIEFSDWNSSMFFSLN